MAKIQVTLHGQTLSELFLEPGQEYFAGRGSQSHIVLENQRGISRQHIRFVQENNVWTAVLISKFGGLVLEGQSVEAITLQGEVRFSVPPYEFYFSEDNPPATITPLEDEIQPENSTEQAHHELALDGKSFSGNLDATAVGVSTLVAYLKINNTQLRTSEILKLEGNMWTLGRHPACEVVINDSAISRKHFDLSRSAEGYFINDHGSSNGTKINGEKIKPGILQKILSGDIIAVRHIEIIFEIHDSNYEMQLAQAPQAYQLAATDSSPALEDEYSLTGNSQLVPALFQTPSEGSPAVLRIPPTAQSKFKRPNVIQITIGVLSLVLVVGLLSNNNSGKTDAPSKATGELSPDKKKQISDIFNLAQNYYVERKYVLCLSQVEKLHADVPFFSNSKELESLCKQALELQQIETDRRRKEETRVIVENKIRSNVEECKAKITPQMTTAELTSCLQLALELDPQNGSVIDLLSQVQIYEQQAQAQLEKKENYAKRVLAGKRVYQSAVSHQHANRLKTALNEYKRFINGQYPGLSQEEDQAKRSISSISENLNAQLKDQIAKCQASLEKADLKNAVLSCDEVLKENPNSKEAQEIRNKAYSQLQREMKSLYEDSRIEESLGNIESAKEKWTRIMDKSVPQDDYYKKAKKSLKKYGIGL